MKRGEFLFILSSVPRAPLLDVPAFSRHLARPVMANRAIWNVRKRHEWLATPLKAKRIKRAQRLRCGLQDALDRKATSEPSNQQES
jgi:hypothetical protein